MLQWLCPLLGLLVVTAVPFGCHIETVRREHAAEEWLAAVSRAQTIFRAANGGGFATNLRSLQMPCSGLAASEPALPAAMTVPGYAVTLRASVASAPVGVDCHGHPTSSDYYAAAAPAPGRRDGRRAFGMTSRRGLFVFFDGIAPTEADMAPGGLATPRAALDTFRIP